MNYLHSRLTRPARIAFMLCLFAAFFIIAPALLFYTAGYRYSFATHTIEKTGALHIDIEPKDAQIIVGNTIIAGKLPLRLTSLAEGLYRIVVSKPGYLPWETEVSVIANQTTYIRDVVLYQNALPYVVQRTTPDDPIAMIPSAHGSSAVLVTEQTPLITYLLFETNTRAQTTLGRNIAPESAHHIFYTPSPFHERILMQDIGESQTKLELLDASDSHELFSHTFPTSSLRTFQWNKADAQRLFVQTDLGIFDLSQQGRTHLHNTTSSAWFVTEKNIYWIEENRLFVSDNGIQTGFQVAPGIHTIHAATGPFILYQRGTSLYYAHLTETGIKEVAHIPQGTVVYNPLTAGWLVYSPIEIWYMNSHGASLIHRSSEPIQAVYPFEANGSLLIQKNETLAAFHPTYNTFHELVRATAIESVLVDRKNRTLFFLGSLGDRKTLYERPY